MALSRGVSGVFVVSAVRTACGTFGGKLKAFTATDLAEVAARGALEASKVDPKLINSVTFGNVMQSSKDAAYVGRHVGIRVGVPVDVPALTVNRLCASGFQAIVNGAQEIMLGECEMVLVGGTENMSQGPYTLRNARFGTRLGQDLVLEDSLWAGLTDQQIKTPMGVTAETLAEKYNISRQECDEMAMSSQTRWKQANDAGVFKTEIVPMKVKGKKGEEVFDTDEHPRLVTLEALAKLPTVFKKNGTVTAGNASGVCDGASALVLVSEAALKKHNLTPLARLVSYGIAGCDPNIMGIGPVPASKAALKAAGKELKDMEICEVNEAFAPQYLSVLKEMGLNPEITNMCGGAIAIGHPLGMSGARISTHLIHELRRKNLKFGLGSACVGGGQGMTLIFERV